MQHHFLTMKNIVSLFDRWNHVSFGLACSTQHIASEGRYQYLAATCISARNTGFQLQQRDVLSSQSRLSIIVTLPIPWMDFHAPQDPKVVQLPGLKKIVCRNLATPTT